MPIEIITHQNLTVYSILKFNAYCITSHARTHVSFYFIDREKQNRTNNSNNQTRANRIRMNEIYISSYVRHSHSMNGRFFHSHLQMIQLTLIPNYAITGNN